MMEVPCAFCSVLGDRPGFSLTSSPTSMMEVIAMGQGEMILNLRREGLE